MLKVHNFVLPGLIFLLVIYLSFCSACNTASPPITTTPTPPSQVEPSKPSVKIDAIKIEFLGQSCFAITSSSGFKIVTDPYTPSSRLTYAEVGESADVVTISHEHTDHNNAAAVGGNPVVIRDSGIKEIEGIPFKGVPAWHDNVQGAQLGADTIFCFTLDGIRFCHAGDLGQRLSPDQIAEIGRVDVLFIPVGGFFTIDANVAAQVVSDLNPKIAIPMHYGTPKFNIGLAGVEDFLKGKENVKKLSSSTIGIKAVELPAATQIVVLQPAR